MPAPGATLHFPIRAQPTISVSLWEKKSAPDIDTCREQLAAEGYHALQWSNSAEEQFGPHAHIYPELLWLIEGSLTIILPSQHRMIELLPGDRIEVPAGTSHGAVTGEFGARYLIATR